LAGQVAIAIRDPRCFPAGPAPGPIYLPPLSGRKSNAIGGPSSLSKTLRQLRVVWFALAAAGTASIVSFAIGRHAAHTEFEPHTASVYRVASAAPSFSLQSEKLSAGSNFTDRWGNSEFTPSTVSADTAASADTSASADEEEPVFFTKSVRTVRFARPTMQDVAAVTGSTGSTGATDSAGKSERPRFPVAYSLASADSRQVDIDKLPIVREQANSEKIVADKDLAEMDEVSQYLWEVYQRAPIKKDGAGDFTWKDPAAAKRMKMSMPKYVILGMDADFREQLYAMGKAMDAAGVKWSILSAFRDDYRQQIASGIKAGASNSLHGGIARTGGYGHGRAVDVSNAEGDMDEVWDWIDDHGAKYGLHRPMPGYDPAHVQSNGDWRKLAGALRQARLKAAKVAAASASASAK
jgi:hypothetical protein